MWRIIFSFLVLYVTIEIVSAVICGQNIDTNSGFRIVGGERAVKGQVPWQVSLLVGGDNHVCGGSIICDNVVLTAAHCFWDFKDKGYKFYAVAGALIRLKGHKIGQLVKVKRVIFHPKWNPKTAAYDIAMLELEKPFKYTHSGDGKHTTAVAPICLPPPNWSHHGNAKISGFGKTTNGGNAADELMFIQESVLPHSNCQQVYGRSQFLYSKEQHVCYGNMKGGKGTCQGDSGGPLVALVSDSRGKRWVQKGVVSYGAICGGKGQPSVFASVVYFLPWIREILKKIGCTPPKY